MGRGAYNGLRMRSRSGRSDRAEQQAAEGGRSIKAGPIATASEAAVYSAFSALYSGSGPRRSITLHCGGHHVKTMSCAFVDGLVRAAGSYLSHSE